MHLRSLNSVDSPCRMCAGVRRRVTKRARMDSRHVLLPLSARGCGHFKSATGYACCCIASPNVFVHAWCRDCRDNRANSYIFRGDKTTIFFPACVPFWTLQPRRHFRRRAVSGNRDARYIFYRFHSFDYNPISIIQSMYLLLLTYSYLCVGTHARVHGTNSDRNDVYCHGLRITKTDHTVHFSFFCFYYFQIVLNLLIIVFVIFIY